ncbi:MaoC family dehydratase N-terminal domain-containing protein [Tsukamurella tyrosinosolvens]|uniref:MaoC family dehydratase N-terminal domain-containing protein n=1 Tax=Tsukamurella tyrosinosolvens TaxID=57704 RepID=UPI0036B3FECD
MSIDRDAALALALPEFPVDVERGRLRFFAQVIGETDPVFTDLDAARAAGHRDLPAPPTFVFGLALEAPEPFGYLGTLGIDLRHILHGEQRFDHHAIVYAGDRITVRESIVDVYAKSGGTLEFLVKRSEFLRDGEPVATATSTIVVRRPQEAAA